MSISTTSNQTSSQAANAGSRFATALPFAVALVVIATMSLAALETTFSDAGQSLSQAEATMGVAPTEVPWMK